MSMDGEREELQEMSGRITGWEEFQGWEELPEMSNKKHYATVVVRSRAGMTLPLPPTQDGSPGSSRGTAGTLACRRAARLCPRPPVSATDTNPTRKAGSAGSATGRGGKWRKFTGKQ